jgi:hypothetical protein
MLAKTSLDGGKSLVSAVAEVFTETISTTFTNPFRVMVEQRVDAGGPRPISLIDHRWC